MGRPIKKCLYTVEGLSKLFATATHLYHDGLRLSAVLKQYEVNARSKVLNDLPELEEDLGKKNV